VSFVERAPGRAVRSWRLLSALAVASMLCTGCGSGWPVHLGTDSLGNSGGLGPGAPSEPPAVGRYTMSGRVVALPGQPVRVCAPELVLYLERRGDDTDIKDCQLGVTAVGVDMGRLQHRREFGGAVEGWASVTGQWDGSALHVDQQADPVQPQPVAPVETPPCAPPAGGWPTVAENENLDSDAVSGSSRHIRARTRRSCGRRRARRCGWSRHPTSRTRTPTCRPFTGKGSASSVPPTGSRTTATLRMPSRSTPAWGSSAARPGGRTPTANGGSPTKSCTSPTSFWTGSAPYPLVSFDSNQRCSDCRGQLDVDWATRRSARESRPVEGAARPEQPTGP